MKRNRPWVGRGRGKGKGKITLGPPSDSRICWTGTRWLGMPVPQTMPRVQSRSCPCAPGGWNGSDGATHGATPERPSASPSPSLQVGTHKVPLLWCSGRWSDNLRKPPIRMGFTPCPGTTVVHFEETLFWGRDFLQACRR